MAGIDISRRASGNIVYSMGRAGVPAKILESLEQRCAVIGLGSADALIQRTAGEVLVDAIRRAVQTVGAVGATRRIAKQFLECRLVGRVHLPYMETDIAAILVRAAAGRKHHQAEIDVLVQVGNHGAQRVQLGLSLLDAVRPALVGRSPIGAVVDDDQNIGVVRRAVVGCVDIGILGQAGRRGSERTQHGKRQQGFLEYVHGYLQSNQTPQEVSAAFRPAIVRTPW